MARTIRYRQIAGELARRLESDSTPPGGLLPSEAELGREFGVSRVTVRRALESLREEGLVASRQGFGWFRAAEPVRQTLARLGTIEDQLEASGLTSERKVLSFAFVSPPGPVAEILGEGQVLEVRRLHLADSRPFGLVTVWCPDDLGREISRADVERHSFVDLLDVSFGGATQTIGASLAGGDDAELLGVAETSPVLWARRVTRDSLGRPVLVAEHVFAAHLTEFVVELEGESASSVPMGLRLVEGS
ncbi:MAG TPA: GntR family transcriptional regulator [Acidimicrobiales bacterium]|nr:GntR family transcriptional regulator [Acidimicrobiales bacterium]